MKSCIFILSVSPKTLSLFAILAVIAIVVGTYLFRYIRKRRKQGHPADFGSEHIGCYFKVLHAGGKHSHVVLLGMEPSTERPLGTREVWFNKGNIPDELLKDLYVIKAESDGAGGIKWSNAPNF